MKAKIEEGRKYRTHSPTKQNQTNNLHKDFDSQGKVGA
jgi:hypothetical protein